MRRRAAAFAALALAAACAPARADVESQIGAQAYRQLAGQGLIINSSPWYAVLNPIARKIARVANRQYAYPFRFILVNQKQPNAFAVPGGNVYVTIALMSFVKNEQELAGVLCHETSHDIHHDVVNLNRKQQTTNEIAAGLSILLGGRSAVVNNIIGIGANLQSLSFSRPVESSADHTGAITCARAGENPWGLVWLFQAFEKADTGGQMEMLSDHPTDAHRIADLEAEFRANPALFGRFSSRASSGTPLPSYRTVAARYPAAKPPAPARRAGY